MDLNLFFLFFKIMISVGEFTKPHSMRTVSLSVIGVCVESHTCSKLAMGALSAGAGSENTFRGL
jgi:hypothetical protein